MKRKLEMPHGARQAVPHLTEVTNRKSIVIIIGVGGACRSRGKGQGEHSFAEPPRDVRHAAKEYAWQA